MLSNQLKFPIKRVCPIYNFAEIEIEDESPVPSPVREKSPEPESPVPMEDENEDESSKQSPEKSEEPVTAGEKGRRRKRKLVPKTYMDEGGFMGGFNFKNIKWW